jgi:hypothetical protein
MMRIIYFVMNCGTIKSCLRRCPGSAGYGLPSLKISGAGAAKIEIWTDEPDTTCRKCGT